MLSHGERLTAELGPTQLKHGGVLPATHVTYQTWGNPAHPAVWVCHAISGDSNAAAWWSRLIGPGKAVDTDRYFVVCSNVIGGCQGSTGPGSAHPEDGKSYGSRFPRIALEDMVAVQIRLADHLGLHKLAMVCGGSMGGMQALEWCVQAGDRVQRAWITASARAHGPLQIGFNEVARQSIMRDPAWQGGAYLPGPGPTQGLAVGRMLGHLTYLSEAAFDAKFGRRLQPGASREGGPDFLRPEIFEVESYLNYQGDKFTQRFDANTFLVVSQAIDDYQCESFERIRAELLVTSFTSDWIYPPHQSEELARLAAGAGCRAAWRNIESPLGHDAFLLDDQEQADAVNAFLSDPQD